MEESSVRKRRIKRLRKAEVAKRTSLNRVHKTKLRRIIKSFNSNVSLDAFARVQSVLSRIPSKLVHRNKKARVLSYCHTRLNALVSKD